MKKDFIWTKEYNSPAEFEPTQKNAYNNDYPHASLAYMTPYKYKR